MFAEWNDRALTAVEWQPDVPLGKGLYSYQTPASLVGMVYQGKDPTYVYQGKDLTPVYQGKDLTPVYQGKDLTPVYQGKDLTPVYQGKDLTPVYQGKDKQPAKPLPANYSQTVQWLMGLKPLCYSQSPDLDSVHTHTYTFVRVACA